MTQEIIYGFILYILPILIVLYVMYVAKTKTYLPTSLEVKKKFPVWAYLLALGLSLIPCINIFTAIFSIYFYADLEEKYVIKDTFLTKEI